MTPYTITLDKERTLKFSNRSFLELEKHLGKPILAILMEALKLEEGQTEVNTSKLTEALGSLKFLTSFVWAGLLHEKISYENCIDIVPMRFDKQMELMTLAMNVITTEFGLTVPEEKKSITEKAPE